MRKQGFTFIIIGFLSCFLFVGCGGGETRRTNGTGAAVATETGAGAVAEQPEESEEPEINKPGESASMGDWLVSVKKARFTKGVRPDKYRIYEPKHKKKNRYLQVTVKAVNRGEKKKTFLPTVGTAEDIKTSVMFKGKEYNTIKLIGYKKNMVGKKVKPGRSLRGELTFEVPKRAEKAKKDVTVQFMNLMGGDVVRFRIGKG